MPRKARIKNEHGTFYIYQKSGGKRHIFESDIDRERFLNILASSQNKFQFKLLAFCILSKDEYHLVIDINGGDVSKIMKSINITYAMYTKCSEKLFKDRYKSQLLNSHNEIIEIINSIHNRYLNKSAWNSGCTFNDFKPLNLFSSLNLVSKCDECIQTIDEAKSKLQDIAIKENKTIYQLINDKNNRNKLICEFRKNSTLSLKELGMVFGGLSESSICKILNQ